MGLGDTVATIQRRPDENTWSRKAGGPAVAFNGLDYRNHPTFPTTLAKARRAAGKAAKLKKSKHFVE